MLTRRLFTVGISVGALVVAATNGFAQSQAGADINISPTRVVFAPDARSAVVYIFNRGSASGTYNISLVDRVMLPSGQVVGLDDPAAASQGAILARFKSAQPLVTFTPRRVTLGPGESQVIRLRVLRPADLAAGEYHAHLTVTTVPTQDMGVTAEEAASDTSKGQLSVRIATLFGISIPLIVRQGPLDVRAGLDNIQYKIRPSGDAKSPGGRTASLTVDMTRLGASSIFGDVEVRNARSGKSGALLGVVRGVAVYPELDRRSAQIDLTAIPASGDRLEIVLKDDDTKPGQALATASFTVP